LIRLEGVSKTFDRAVLTDVDLSVPERCLFGLIGPGASGKSLLLRMITGLMRPDRGKVTVDGQDVLAIVTCSCTSSGRGSECCSKTMPCSTS